MEMGELIAIAVLHEEGNEDCPFCPVEKGKDYKTYKGSDNRPDTLEKIMVDPTTLSSNQNKSWPHDGTKHPSREEIQAKHEHPEYGFYEFQAHHLISGKQALNGHKIEQWIDSSQSKIDEDTGYTVNGSLNGVWAPSWPKNFRNGIYQGQWTTGPINRQEIANRVMKVEGCQFHLGAHNIGDPEDSGEIMHQRYDNWLKSMLTKINLRIWGWSRKCPLCCDGSGRKEPPFQTNEKVNAILNRLSAEAKRQLTAPRKDWTIFLSRLALNYHNEVCEHPIPGRTRSSR